MFKVHIGYTLTGRDRWLKFATLAAANSFCNDVLTKTGVVLTVIAMGVSC